MAAPPDETPLVFASPPAVPTVMLSSGHAMPLIQLGTWKGGRGEIRRAVESALACGYRAFDSASYYGTEHEVGDALFLQMGHGSVRREELFVCTKLWNSDHGAGKVIPALKRSLTELKLSYVDLYLIHWPVTGRPGDTVDPPLAETWAEMEAAVGLGLARSIGVSNFSIPKVQALLATASIPPAVVQVECHPYFRQEKLRAWCAARGIHVTAYSSLGSPDSASLLRRTGPTLLEDPAVVATAQRLGCSPAQVLIRWGLEAGLSVLPKSVTPARIAANLDVLNFSLDAAAKAALGRLPQCRMVDGSFFVSPRGPYRSMAQLWDE